MLHKLTVIFFTFCIVTKSPGQQAVSLHRDSLSPVLNIRLIDTLRGKFFNQYHRITGLVNANTFKNLSDSVSPKNIAKKIFKTELNSIGMLMDKQKIESFYYKQLSKDMAEILDINRPIIINGISGITERQNLHSSNDTNNYYLFSQSALNVDAQVMNIPLIINYQYQDFTNPFYGTQVNNFSFSFDKDAYLRIIKNKLKGKFNPQELVPKDLSVEKLKNDALAGLSNEIDNIKNKYKGLLDNELQGIGRLGFFFEKDISQFSQQYLNAAARDFVTQGESQLAQLQERINNGEKYDARLLDSLKNRLIKYKGVQEVVEKIKEHKNRWESGGLIKAIKQSEIAREMKINQLLNNPALIGKIAKNKLNLNGLQQLFLKLTKLNIGQADMSMSELTLKNFIAKGINTNYLNGNKYLSAIVSKQPEFTSIWDAGLGNNLVTRNNVLTGFSMGKGEANGAHNHLSFLFFKQTGGGGYNPQFQGGLNRMTLVTTINTVIKFGEKNSLAMEVSNSSTQFNNETGLNDTTRIKKSVLNNLFNAKYMLRSLAASVEYRAEYPKTGLTHDLSIRYISNGYYNPGNAFLPAGSKELKTGFKKSFLNRRLLVSVKASYRDYDFSGQAKHKWVSNSIVTDAKWKMKKGQYAGLRFTHFATNRLETNNKYRVNTSSAVSAELNLYKRFGKIVYRNYSNLGIQLYEHMMYGIGSIQNRSTVLNIMQTLVVRKKSLFLNVNYNKAKQNSDFIFLNSSMLCEAGLSYNLKGILCSSSLVYNSVANWYKQVAIRQSVSGEIGKRLTMNFYINAGKNVRLYQFYPVSPVRMEWSLQYLFKR